MPFLAGSTFEPIPRSLCKSKYYRSFETFGPQSKSRVKVCVDKVSHFDLHNS